jgi:nuclear pore complex protein Nup160
MADRAPLYSHKETRLNLESPVPGSTVSIRLPTFGASSLTSRTGQKRPLPTDTPAEDENGFKLKHLASEGSIYHRRHNRSPRSFLWRILEEGKVLSIQVVDLCKQDKKDPDAYLTLRLILPSAIRPTCVAFSDSKDHDYLSAFVLTESNHLYAFTLRPEYFRRLGTAEDSVGDWCKIYLSSAFSFKHPHRLVALGYVILTVIFCSSVFFSLDNSQNVFPT